VQIGRVNLARIECDNDTLASGIDLYILHAIDFAERLSQFPHALIAIFTFGSYYDSLNDFVIGPLGVKRVSGVRIVWSRRVHALSNAPNRSPACMTHFVIASKARAI